MYRPEDYKKAYKEFEQWAKDEGYEDIGDLERCCSKRSVADDLHFFRVIRNSLSHIPRAEKRLELTDTFKTDFESLCKQFMINLTDVAIPAKDIFKREISDAVGPTIKIMKERVFSHTPIMMGRKVWGVFSENTLFDLAEKNEFKSFDGSTRFMDIASYITAYGHSSVYDFISRGTSLENVKRIFSEATKKGRKLEVLFITTTGNKDGELVGMITIWDLTTI